MPLRKKFSAIASIAMAMYFTACGDIIHGESCKNIYHPNLKLADCQKTIGNFKKGNTTHYIHSQGFEFDLYVEQDTTFIKELREQCLEGDEEDRTVILSSTYPIMSVEVNFYGYDDSYPMNIRHGGTLYFFNLDSTGTPQTQGIEGDVVKLDTITFNGITYDSVFVIMDNSHYAAKNYNDDSFANGKLAHLYFSKTKGILKLETTDGESFTIKEGNDNE